MNPHQDSTNGGRGTLSMVFGVLLELVIGAVLFVAVFALAILAHKALEFLIDTLAYSDRDLDDLCTQSI